MQHYWPRLESALTNAPGKARPIFFATATGTPTLPNVNRVRPGYACDRFFKFAMRQAARTNISTVVFTCFWEKYFIGSFPGGPSADLYRVGDQNKTPLRIGTPAASQVFNEFGDAIAELRSMGKEVVVLLSTPASTLLDPRATSRLAFRAAVTNQVQISREAFETFLHPVMKEIADIVRKNGGQVIDPLDYFDEAGYFNAKAPDGRFRYKDASHLRPFYVTERATFLDSLIRTTGVRRGELSQVEQRVSR